MEALRQSLSRLAEAHRSLLSRARTTECACVDATLSLGVALELHRAMIGFFPEPARAFLDENVVAEIDAEGGRIAENLAHLASLRESDPASSEIEPLAAALLRRMRAHLERHDRAVFRPLSRFYLERASDAPRPNPTGDVLDLEATPNITGEEHDPDA